MHKRPDHHEEPEENDALWQLLGQVPSPTASPRFAENTVRAARLLPVSKPWWAHLLSPLPLAATAAVLAISFLVLSPTPVSPSTAETQETTELAELAATETLRAATDHLDSFSDTELASMIGFP